MAPGQGPGRPTSKKSLTHNALMMRAERDIRATPGAGRADRSLDRKGGPCNRSIVYEEQETTEAFVRDVAQTAPEVHHPATSA